MGKVIDQFGKIVGNTLPEHPETVLRLLRAAYGASGLQARYLPNHKLLPHQRYAALVSNRAIRAPLANPRNSAVVNLFLPCEILQAMDITPQFTEGLAGYLNGAGSERVFIECAEKSGVPGTFCSYHKALLGAALSGMLPKPSFVVNTTLACDANLCTFRALADHWQIPHFTIDVPDACNRETIAYVSAQFQEMAGFAQDATGRKLDINKLKETMRRENRCMDSYRAYFQELSGKHLRNDLTSEMYRLFFTHVLLGTPESEHYFQLLLDDVRKADVSKDEKRILWVHSMPFWQDSMKAFFNFNDRYQLLCSDLNFDSVTDMDENRPYESMARKVLQNTLRGPHERRAEKILGMARELRADGVVYFCHWGCKQTLGGSLLAKDMLEQEGVPVLLLDGDGCDRGNVNDGQMGTRLQAFLEMLEAAG